MTIHHDRGNRRRLGLALAFALALCAPSRALADDHGSHGDHGFHSFELVPPDATFRGLTYPEWQARWWQWAASVPIIDGSHPNFPGGDPTRGQSGNVWFLGAPTAGDELEVRHITIPEGTALFFPALNAECSTIEPFPFHGDNRAELRACAKDFTDRTVELHIVIDGQRIRNLERFRHQSPVFALGPFPADNIFGGDPGTTAPSVDDGFYVMVLLQKGTHKIRFGGAFDTSDLPGFLETSIFDVEYRVKVLKAR
jgi:hypothetical protein